MKQDRLNCCLNLVWIAGEFSRANDEWFQILAYFSNSDYVVLIMDLSCENS